MAVSPPRRSPGLIAPGSVESRGRRIGEEKAGKGRSQFRFRRLFRMGRKEVPKPPQCFQPGPTLSDELSRMHARMHRWDFVPSSFHALARAERLLRDDDERKRTGRDQESDKQRRKKKQRRISDEPSCIHSFIHSSVGFRSFHLPFSGMGRLFH